MCAPYLMIHVIVTSACGGIKLTSILCDVIIGLNSYSSLQFNCDGHTFISFVFPQFTSFHSVFHSFHGLMNSINWPSSSVWVFIAQLVEHCSANAEATSSNPVQAPKKLFFGLLRNCLNCDSTAMVTHSFHLYSRSSHHFILYFIAIV